MVAARELIGFVRFDAVPDYVLGTLDNLTIYWRAVTVGQQPPLSELLKPNMGVCHWAACTKVR